MSFLRLFVHDPQAPLLFNSGTFFFVFTLFIAAFAVLYRWTGVRLVYVFLFSLFYYYKCNGLFMVALLATTVIDYLIALQIARAGDKPTKKRLMWLSVGISLSILGYFKYTNFVLQSFSLLIGRSHEPWAIFLPIGISFYTFQSIAYVVDVYRGRLEPCRSLLDYAFFLSFFPQVVAGPICRARELIPQIRQTPELTTEGIGEGLFLIIRGLAKKALIADYIGLFCDLVFDQPQTYSSLEVALAVYGYAFQIYFDFSGYSDLAIGMARVTGIKLPDNFRQPYKAPSPTEFWARWHITLSTWFRDYVMFPLSLSGNARSKVSRYGKMVLTMLLCGLWHGPSWSFVLWGGMHGVGLVIHKLITQRWPVAQSSSRWRAAAGWLVTFHFVLLSWILFRSKDFTTAWLLLQQLFTGMEWAKVVAVLEARRFVAVAILAGAVFSFIPARWADELKVRFSSAPVLAKAVVFLLLVQGIIQLQLTEVQPFIYFQF